MKVIALSSFIIFCQLVSNASYSAQLTGEKVLAAVKKQYSSVKDYRAEVSLTIKGPGISVKNMKMQVFYKRPNKIRVEAKSGMAMIPQGNFFGNPIDELAKNMAPVYLGSEKKQGVDCHLIRLNPNDNSPGAVPVKVWVDKDLNLIKATEVGEAPAMRSTWSYVNVSGNYLPSQINAELIAEPGKGSQPTKITVKFSKYVVNRGIDDRVFSEKPR